MKSITQYILEGRTIDEIVVKDQNNKEVNVVYYCYDKDSLDKIVKRYEYPDKFWDDKILCIATLKNKSTWAINTDKEWKFNVHKINDNFIEHDKEEKYTYNELIDLLEKGEIMLVVININK